jgi:hypothetical protein
MRWLLVLGLSGCLSWTQADPPTRPGHPCGRDYTPAVVAGAIAAGTGAGATTIFVRTGEGLGDLEARSWGVILVMTAVGYTIDALNAYGDAKACRREPVAQPIPAR